MAGMGNCLCTTVTGDEKSYGSQSNGQFTLKFGTFNLLAPCYKVIHSREGITWWGGKKESSDPDLFLQRYDQIFKILDDLPSFDFLCLQEFWFHSEIAELFEKRVGDRYVIYKHKRPAKNDGVAMLVGRKYIVKDVEYIKFNDVGMRVALLMHLINSETNQEVLVVTTHLTYLASALDNFLRMTQAKKVLQAIDLYISSLDKKDIPLFLCGDFNGEQKGPIYEYLTDAGFISAYKACHGSEPRVTHSDHNGVLMCVDYVFYKMPYQLECTVSDAYLIPKESSDQDWPEEFTASDHRPVFAELLITPKSTGNGIIVGTWHNRAVSDGDIVWAKHQGDIYWPGKVVDDVDAKDEKLRLIYFFDENTWEPVKKLRVRSWECKRHSFYVKKGENLKDTARKLSFGRAMEMAVEENKGRQKNKARRGRQKKKQLLSNSGIDEEKKKSQTCFNEAEESLTSNANNTITADNDFAVNHDKDDDDDLPEAFTPLKKMADSFTEGDLIWAKYKKDPYWPAIFHSLMKKKNGKVAWVWFVDETWKMTNIVRKIVSVPSDKITSYHCDPRMREEIMKEGREFKSKVNFENIIQFADEYAETKAESEEDEPNVRPRGSAKRSINFKKMFSQSRSKRGTTMQQKYKALLDALEDTRPTLLRIFEGEIESERHEIFLHGTTKNKNMLKYRSGFGCIEDEKMADDILDKLRQWFEQCGNKCESINASTYVSEVWLPEAMILAIMKCEGVEREKAEEIYINGE
eukprot:gene9793-10792_t